MNSKRVRFTEATLQRDNIRTSIREWQRKHKAHLDEVVERIKQQLREEESNWLDWYSIQEATKQIYLDKLFLSHTELKEYQWLFYSVKERTGLNCMNTISLYNK